MVKNADPINFDAQNGNFSNSLDLIEVFMDLFSSLVINNDLFADYVKSDVAPIVEKIISGDQVELVEFIKVKQKIKFVL